MLEVTSQAIRQLLSLQMVSHGDNTQQKHYVNVQICNYITTLYRCFALVTGRTFFIFFNDSPKIVHVGKSPVSECCIHSIYRGLHDTYVWMKVRLSNWIVILIEQPTILYIREKPKFYIVSPFYTICDVCWIELSCFFPVSLLCPPW